MAAEFGVGAVSGSHATGCPVKHTAVAANRPL